MMKNYLLTIGFLAAFFLKVQGQAPVVIVPYPSPSQSLTIGKGKGTLTVRVAIPNVCTTNTVTLAFPESIQYVPSSLQQLAGTSGFGISESNISNLRTPVFSITGVTQPGDITFSVEREALCGASPGVKDTVIVANSCGSHVESNPNVNSYSVFSPALSLAPPAPLANKVVGNTGTRTIVIANGGNGQLDTVYFRSVHVSGRVSINNGSKSILANGISFSPITTSGDTSWYKFYGPTFFSGDSTFSNGEIITVVESYQIESCNPVSEYSTGWGVDANTVCGWVNGIATMSMAGGVPTLTSITYSNVNYVDRCTPYDINFTAYNGGTGNDTAGAMFNVVINHGYVYPGRSVVQAYDASILAYRNGRINGNSVSTFTTTGNIVTMDLEDLFTSDPDGAGVGLEDLDGDGYYDDLPRGNSFTYTLELEWLCTTSCGQNKIYYSGGNLDFTDMCGDSRSSFPDYSYRPVYESSFSGTASMPANIIGGTPFRLKLIEGHYINSYIHSTSNTRYVWKVILPSGYSVSGSGNPTYGTTSTNYSQVGDTVIITSPSSTLDSAGINLVLTCGNGGTVSIPYTLQKVDDITSGCDCQGMLICATVNATAFCPGPCPDGPSNYIPVVRRTDGSLGWTDNTMATRQVASAISAYDLSKALFLDTIQITGTARQNSNTNNLHLELSLGKAGSANKLSPLDIDVTIIRNGTAYNYSSTVAVDNSSGSTQIVNWDLSAGMLGLLPGDTMQVGDSIVTVSRYVVATNAGLPQNDVQSGGRFFHFSIINGVREYCFDPVPEMYLVGTTALDGRNGFYTSACNITSLGGSGSNLARRFNTSGTQYENEFRPTIYIDSVVMRIPNGYDLISMTNNLGGGTMTPDYQIGTDYTYINPGTWRPLDLTVTNTYGASFRYSVQPTCKTVATATHGIKFYIKDFYYNTATKSTFPSQYQYILNNSSGNTASRTSFRTQTITYSATNKPILVLQNLSGEVVATKSQEYWDLEIRNDGLSTASNLWIAFEKDSGSNIVIDSAVALTGNVTLTPQTYGGSNHWYQVSTSGLTSGSTTVVRAYFKYGSCTKDSILVKTGWNCGAYPNPDPESDTNACSVAETYAAVSTNSSEVQLILDRQPGGGSSIQLCTVDSLLFRVNSAQGAYLLDPKVEIFPPAGVTVDTNILVEYPANSNNFETLSLDSIGGGYRLNLLEHSQLDSNGLPGTIDYDQANPRQTVVKLFYNSGCQLASGASFTLVPYGNKTCGVQQAEGSGKATRTTGIYLQGATTNGVVGLDVTMPNDSFFCNRTENLRIRVTPVIAPTSNGDTIVTELPEGLQWQGNFIQVANCTNCSAVLESGVNGSTRVKVALDSGVAIGTVIEYGFQVKVNPNSDCGESEVINIAKRKIPSLSCNGVQCVSSSAIVGSSYYDVWIIQPDLKITDLQGHFSQGAFSLTAKVRNDGNNMDVQSGDTVIIEYYIDEDKDGLFDSTVDIKVGEKVFNYYHPTNTTMNYWAKVSYTGVVDSSKAMMAVISPARSPNCLCNLALSPRLAGLPVDITEFSVHKQDETAVLKWTTASEVNNSRFEIWRKIEGAVVFEKIGEVVGAGTSNSVLNYQYEDDISLFSVRVYYQLRQVDYDGNSWYSAIKYLDLVEKDKQVLYPNPANSILHVRGAKYYPGQKFVFRNAIGQTVLEDELSEHKSINLNSIPEGTYFVGFEQGSSKNMGLSFIVIIQR